MSCLTDAERDADWADDSGTDGSPAGVAKQEAEATSFGEECSASSTEPRCSPTFILRAVLGEQKLTYLGYSYGTHIGYAYTEAYPDKVRATVPVVAGEPKPELPTK